MGLAGGFAVQPLFFVRYWGFSKMHGLITTYDNKKGTGRVQGDDGHIYFFNRDMLSKPEEEDSFMMDMEVEFTSSEDSDNKVAADIYLTDPKSVQDKSIFYQEPASFLCETEDLVSGYDVLDRGLFALQRSERTEEKARNALIRECVGVGANSLVSYKVERQLKSAFGNGFETFTVRGVPVVLGRIDDKGEMRAADLKNRLNQEKIKKAHNIIVNTRIGKLVLKGMGAVLLIIFALGFFLTGGI